MSGANNPFDEPIETNGPIAVYCFMCNAEINENDDFCSNCGTKLNEEDDSPPTQTANINKKEIILNKPLYKTSQKRQTSEFVSIAASIAVMVSLFLPWLGTRVSGIEMLQAQFEALGSRYLSDRGKIEAALTLAINLGPILFSLINLILIGVRSAKWSRIFNSFLPIIIWSAFVIHGFIEADRIGISKPGRFLEVLGAGAYITFGAVIIIFICSLVYSGKRKQ